MKIIVYLVFLVTLIPSVSAGESQVDDKGHEKMTGVVGLSTGLRALLSKEMFALQDGMADIIPAYTSGRWGEIEVIAGKMKNSYILKQSLTEAQKKELHSALPVTFKEKDQQFHYLAGMLEHTAKNKKAELVSFYIYKMIESCVDCHTLYATHQFPSLLVEGKVAHSH
jgi:hypothetical protein